MIVSIRPVKTGLFVSSCLYGFLHIKYNCLCQGMKCDEKVGGL